MKNVFKISGVCFILLFQLTSCLNDDEKGSIYHFYDEPVVVSDTGEYASVRSEAYSFYVPGLAGDTTLKKDGLLWTSFIVDTEEKPPLAFDTHYYTARHFRYQTVDSTKVIIPAGDNEFKSYLSDDYSDPIELSVLYKYTIDSLWFFGFKHRNHSNQLRYTYELVLRPEIENQSNEYPTLYIRSKQINSEKALGNAHSKDGNIFAFDVTDFAKYYKENYAEKIASDGQIRFNLKYKTGVNTEGNDTYREFMSNPISWHFKAKRS